MKNFENLQLDDVVVSYERYSRVPILGKIVGITKTEFKILPDLAVREIRVKKKSGNEVGHDRWWRVCDDIPAMKKRRAEALKKQQEQRQAREDALQERKTLIRQMNPNLCIQKIPLGLHYVVFMNRNQWDNILIFVIEENNKNGVLIKPITYGRTSSRSLGFSSHGPYRGETLEDAIYEAMEINF